MWFSFPIQINLIDIEENLEYQGMTDRLNLASSLLDSYSESLRPFFPEGEIGVHQRGHPIDQFFGRLSAQRAV